MEDFVRVHPQNVCEVEETATGDKVGFRYENEFGSGGYELPEMALRCNTDGVESAKYVVIQGKRIEVSSLPPYRPSW